jgi:hypothetical protein
MHIFRVSVDCATREPIPATPAGTIFRSYADCMQSPELVENVQRVAELATGERCTLMCAEAVPWRCHRSPIGDALLVRGVGVEDIIGPGNASRTPSRRSPRWMDCRLPIPPSVDALRLVSAIDRPE